MAGTEALGVNGSIPAAANGSMPATGNGSMPAASDVNVHDVVPPAPPLIVHPYATVSVKAHVPVTLEMKNSNYTKWASLFKSMCGKFGLKWPQIAHRRIFPSTPRGSSVGSSRLLRADVDLRLR